MLEVCKKLFTLWGENNVSYCHWKSNEHLLEGLEGTTDLDVYVKPSDKEKAERLLVECQYIECIVQKSNRYPNVVEWIGFDEETGKLVHVHLHYQIITGTKFCKEYVFPIDEQIILTRVKDAETEVFVTNPDLEIIILYCRIALKASNHKKIRPDKNDFKEIAFLKNAISHNNVMLLCQQFMGESGAIFFSLIEKDNLSCKDWENVYEIANKWLAPYRKYSKMTVFARHHYFKARGIILLGLDRIFDVKSIKKKTFPSKGVSICFLGQDGSGKSTLSIKLCEWINWKIEASRFYLGSGDHYNGLLKRLLPKAASITKRRPAATELSTSRDSSSKAGNNNESVKHSLIKIFSSILNSISLRNIAKRAYREVRSAEKYKMKHGIAFFDRFPQNQFEALYDGPKIRYNYLKGQNNFLIRILAKQEERYINDAQKYQPDLIFKLVLPVEESMRRKPEENKSQVAKKAEITEKLVFEKSKTYVVDATQDFNKELLFIKQQIWNLLVNINS